MKTVLFLFIAFFTMSLSAQTMPEVTVGDKHLKLSKLKIQSTIVGNVATTSYDMTFLNPQNRILEGELTFPLGQGQSVSHFAMDVNGQLRSAVVVEKELGRVAYESTVRQVIDPGLLEKSSGNNYRARVYPIPARGQKRIIVTFEENLKIDSNAHKLLIPLQSKNILNHFSIEVNQYSEGSLPFVSSTTYKDLIFKRVGNKNSAKFEAKNYKPNKPVSIEFPIMKSEMVTTYKDYFNIYTVVNKAPKPRNAPKALTLFWDTSLSMQYRNIDKELTLLDTYFKSLNQVEVRLITFSNSVKNDQTYTVSNGNWELLQSAIKALKYDGGTAYDNLDQYLGNFNLMFSDGLNNLGDFKIEDAFLMTINSVVSSNHQKLEQLATANGGQYINLNTNSLASAIQLLTNDAYKFLGFIDNDMVYEVYPRSGVNVQGDFSVSGRFSQPTTIQLKFGYNDTDYDLVSVDISTVSNNDVVKRLWATQKLNMLSLNKEENKDQIINLSKRYQLISDFTSLIVLDRIEDYVRYEIEPPRELMSDYKSRLRLAQVQNKERLRVIEKRKEVLYDNYKSLLRWYNTDFAKLKTKKLDKQRNSRQVATTNNTQSNTTQSNATVELVLEGDQRLITGTVTSIHDGLPLPGVNVMVKGTSRGVQTDFDGNYSIGASEGESLVFSFVGLNASEQMVGTGSTINVAMTEDLAELETVVVTGYRGATNATYRTSSLATVSAESVEEAPTVSVAQLLQGQVAGINIAKSSGQPSESSTIIIRGNSSLKGGSEPLFIVDGVPISESEFRSIQSKEVESIEVLNGNEVKALYGNRAASGVVIINTKKGLITNKEQIETMNAEVDAAFEVKEWQPNAEYVTILSNMENVESAYGLYLDLRKTYAKLPMFYMDVAIYFESKGANDLALQVLTNLIEIDIDNYELMRALAYKLEAMNEYQAAAYVYEAVLELRPEHPQSYRDLALAYEMLGKYQEAFDLLYQIINGDLLSKDIDQRYEGIEDIAFIEASHLVQLHKKELDLTKHQLKLFKEISLDIRITIDWNQDNTDIDLWVLNPSNEKIFYGNDSTDDGSRMSPDLTEGFGPEEFMLKNAPDGNFDVLVDYYGNRIQKFATATTLKITMYTNYGKPNETKKVSVMRLSGEDEEYEVGNLQF